MCTLHRINRPAAHILLAAILLVTQTTMLAHAYEHDAGSPQKLTCSTCIVADTTTSACLDNASPLSIVTGPAPAIALAQLPRGTCRPVTARQRAPPANT